MKTPLDSFTPERLNGRFSGTLMEALGIRITETGADFLVATMPVDERTRQPFGLLHGGASAALAETLASVGANALLGFAGSSAVGLEINASHLRPVSEGHVTGEARPLKIGRSIQVWQVEVRDGQGRLTCVSRVTMAVVPAGP